MGQSTLARKVTWMLGALGALLIAVALLALIQLRQAEGRYARLFEEDARGLLVIPRMNVVLHDTARLALQRLNPLTQDEGPRADREFALVRGRLRQETATLRAALPEYSPHAAEIEQAFDVLLSVGQQMREASQARQLDRARSLLRTQFAPRFERLREYFNVLGERVRLSMLEQTKSTEAIAHQIFRRTLILGAIILAVGLLVGQLWVWTAVGCPLRELVNAIRRLMAGDLNLAIPCGGRNDEIGMIASALGVFRQQLVRKQELESEERENLARLQRSQQLLQSITDNAGAFIFAKDAQGRYLFVNQLYVNLLKRPAAELLGRTAVEIFGPEAGAAFAVGEAEVLAQGIPRTTQVTAEFAGQPRHFFAHKFPLFDADGRIFGLAGVSTDVSEIKQVQKDLAEARDAAEAANRAKSAFVATMSHEIRTPMNAILNMTALTLETDLNSRQRQYLSVAHASAKGLLALLNDILDFSKIEADRLELERAPFHLRLLLEEVANAFRGRVLESHLEFAMLVAEDVPDHLLGDTLRLRQVLTNLLGNAFKFTERGSIAVRVTCESPTEAPSSSPSALTTAAGTTASRSPDRAPLADPTAAPPGLAPTPSPASASAEVTLRFVVTDTGIGVPAEKLGQLFAAFSQADSSTSRKYGGTGLGLAICRRLVRLMGGEIVVASEAGQGSTFTFTARFGSLPDTTPAKPVLPDCLRHARALVVEDSDLSRELLLTMLRRFGLECEGVESGELGWQRLTTRRESAPFDLVVLDWLLPDLNGLELARRIRTLPEGRRIALVMVSAFASEREEQAARQLGIHAFLPKPITGSLLLDAITQATGLRPEPPAPAPSPADSRSPLAGRHVLVAEDNEANQFVAREILQRAGASVAIAPNGRVAVEMAERETFDLILMDMQMPEMDGLEATQLIRANTARRRVPIIALTANALKGDVDACLAAGMDDYVAKPIDRTAFFATLHRWLSEPTTTTPPPSTPPPPSAPTITIPTVAAEPAATPTPPPPAPSPTIPVPKEGESHPPTASDSERAPEPRPEPRPEPEPEPALESEALREPEWNAEVAAETGQTPRDQPEDALPEAPRVTPNPELPPAPAPEPGPDQQAVQLVAGSVSSPLPSAPPPATSAPDPVIPSAPDSASASEPTAAPKPRAARRKRVVRDVQLDLLAPPPADALVDIRQTVANGRLPGVDLEDATQRLGLPREVLETMLLQFGQGQRRTLQELRQALADGNREAARLHSHSLAGAAGNLSMHELRRLAKTVELAVKFQQGDVLAMCRELEQEASRVFAGLEILAEQRTNRTGASAAPGPGTIASSDGSALGRSVANLPGSPLGEAASCLERLARSADDGDLDALQEAFDALRNFQPAPLSSGEVTRLESLLTAFDHAAAAKLARQFAERLGAPQG